MKFVIAAVIIIGLSIGGWNLYVYWGNFKEKEAPAQTVMEIPATQLHGMPPKLEPILVESQRQGASGLHNFLTTYGKMMADPRLASIELDYVVLVAHSDPAEARKVFAKVKQRIGNSSPVRNRVQQLEKTFE